MVAVLLLVVGMGVEGLLVVEATPGIAGNSRHSDTEEGKQNMSFFEYQ
jgi:hypothetical protein